MIPEEAAQIVSLRDALGRRDYGPIAEVYARHLRRPGSQELDPVEDWAFSAVYMGDDPDTEWALDVDVWFDLIIATADALSGHHSVWVLGDGPAESLVGGHPEMFERFHRARATHPGVDAMVRAVQEEYRDMGHPDTPWSDPSWLPG